MYDAITDVTGLKAGHYTDLEAATGCTVVLCEQGAIAGVDVRGSAPGTRETDLLRPMNQVERVHAVLLGGGSAFGLDAASGVMRYLEEKNIGFLTPGGIVPIVPAAVLFDLAIGNPKVRPGATEGYQACRNATDGEVPQGCVGAGTGAMVGQLFGINRATKSGLGTASETIGGGVVVGAIVAVNALGDVYDSATGQIAAGVRKLDGKGFGNTVEYLKEGQSCQDGTGSHTTIGIVATNVSLTKEQTNKMAQMAHDGMARAINPCHTMLDGDTIFALSLGQKQGDLNVIGTLTAEVLRRSIIKAVTSATSLASIPASKDIPKD